MAEDKTYFVQRTVRQLRNGEINDVQFHAALQTVGIVDAHQGAGIVSQSVFGVKNLTLTDLRIYNLLLTGH